MARRIPNSEINLFQLIYILLKQYRENSGMEPLNLSLGNPDGIPPEEILELESRFAKDPAYDYHAYAEDKNLFNFAEGMVSLHSGVEMKKNSHLEAFPIAGIKTTSALLLLACGLGERRDLIYASNLPAYDIVGVWGEKYLKSRRMVWPLCGADNMRLNVRRLKEAVARLGHQRLELIFTVRPGNPASVGASHQEWTELISFCLERKIRLANDGAYAGLAGEKHVPLASVAKDYPELEWVEMYSVSKSFNDPGARLGAIVGSADFVRDYLMIKGNTDSGPVPFVMAAYGKFLQDPKNAREVLSRLRDLYRRRLEYVIPLFKKSGLIPACETEAGFFTLWKVPGSVLGVDLAREAKGRNSNLAEAFNRLVISKTGLAGVHFLGQDENGDPEPLIRYAVCADVLNPLFKERFEAALETLRPRY